MAETMIKARLDAKATINIGEYSRCGRSCGLIPVKALDRDMTPKEKLIPGGILEPMSGRAFLFVASSNKTNDFMADFHPSDRGGVPLMNPYGIQKKIC